MSNNKTLKRAISAIIVLNLSNLGHAMDEPAIKGMEKCYHIAKAGMNDCSNATHSCSGEAKINRDPKEWVFVPTGLCKRIADGSTDAS